MARRAQQGSVARCPYCEAFLPQVAVECPACRFPLTMAAAEGGFVTPEHSGTTSTATPGGRSVSPMVAGHAPAAGQRFHGTRAHRIRVAAWLLGVTSILLLLAGAGAFFSASSPEAADNRQAVVSLNGALNHATANRSHVDDLAVPTVAAGEPSDGARKVSVDEANGLWFGAARSISGRCYLLIGRLSNGTTVGQGTLAKADPCTGGQVRLRSETRLAKVPR